MSRPCGTPLSTQYTASLGSSGAEIEGARIKYDRKSLVVDPEAMERLDEALDWALCVTFMIEAGLGEPRA